VPNRARAFVADLGRATPLICSRFTNSEKQARYRERHFGVDGEKVRVGLILNATTKAKKAMDMAPAAVIQ
jgi:hypothetical protein